MNVKRSLFYLIIITSILGCAAGAPSPSPSPSLPPADTEELYLGDIEASDRQILALMTYDDLSHAWREKAASTHQRIEEYSKLHQGKIASSDLLAMHELAIRYIRKIRGPLMDIVRSRYSLFESVDEIKLQTEKVSHIEHDVIRYQSGLGEVVENAEDLREGETYKEIKVDIYQINPLDPQGQFFLREFKISLAASILLLDNYNLGLEPYFRNKLLRRSLFFDIPDAYHDARIALREIWLGYDKNTRFAVNLKRAFDIYQESRHMNEFSSATQSSPYLDEVDSLIQNTFTYKELVKSPNGKGLIKHLVSRARHFLKNRRDEIFLLRKGTTHLFSKIFGSTVGIFQTRGGKLKNMSEDELQHLISSLKPLDILVEKTPFRLTDKFIPGHYGHVAIWVGTEKELKKTGAWDLLPHYYKIAKEHYSYEGPSFQESIRNGRNIIEALRPGVDVNSMRNFLNIDDLAVIRPRYCPEGVTSSKTCLTQNDERQYILEAFKQIGKDYDFNFDANTENKIVCSEMAYRTFLKIDFETKKVLGKHSINPDQVVLKADDPGDPFYPIILYYNGKRVPGDTTFLQAILKLLINKEYESVENKIEGSVK